MKKLLYILVCVLIFSLPIQAQNHSRNLGGKSFEVSNHLGNVMAVVSDRKIPIPETTKIAYTETDIKSFNDYYPYGMLLEDRNDSKNYRYGFQGQEKDDKVKGKNNTFNYKYRVHDPRLGRFFAVDPLSVKYPFYSQYAYSGNRVIDMIELEGLEPGNYFIGRAINSIWGDNIYGTALMLSDYGGQNLEVAISSKALDVKIGYAIGAGGNLQVGNQINLKGSIELVSGDFGVFSGDLKLRGPSVTGKLKLGDHINLNTRISSVELNLNLYAGTLRPKETFFKKFDFMKAEYSLDMSFSYLKVLSSSGEASLAHLTSGKYYADVKMLYYKNNGIKWLDSAKNNFDLKTNKNSEVYALGLKAGLSFSFKFDYSLFMKAYDKAEEKGELPIQKAIKNITNK